MLLTFREVLKKKKKKSHPMAFESKHQIEVHNTRKGDDCHYTLLEDMETISSRVLIYS